MIRKPPSWIKYLTRDVLEKALKSDDISKVIKQAEKEYAYWDKFKYYPLPKGFTPEEAWAFLKFSRISNRESSQVKDKAKNTFGFTITKTMHQQLSYIDSNASGILSSSKGKPTTSQEKDIMISSLTEEAIASSQIEGANTSRKVAKQMIFSKKEPKTTGERMILNNYHTMQRLSDWKDLELSKDMLIDIQKTLTQNTLKDPKDEGRFRKDDDNIHVTNSRTGEVIFTPPKEDIYKKELERLIRFANQKEDTGDFIHPVIKGSILHFWLAYLHPFPDGNGRTARAIFYWYMLKEDYWLFKHLSVSRVIKKSKSKYDNSFIFSEIDDNDLTYFLSYKLKAITKSIKEFVEHYHQKIEKDKLIEKAQQELKEFNERQVELLQYLNLNKIKRTGIQDHQAKHRISYQTARVDLLELAQKGLLQQIKSKNKFIFIPNTAKIKKLMEQVD